MLREYTCNNGHEIPNSWSTAGNNTFTLIRQLANKVDNEALAIQRDIERVGIVVLDNFAVRILEHHSIISERGQWNFTEPIERKVAKSAILRY